MDKKSPYRNDGILFPIPVLRAEEVKRYRAACEKLELELGGRPRTVEVRQMHLHMTWAYELATHPRVLDAVETILGHHLLVWSTELFTKHPGDGISIGWHRDEDYTGFDPNLSTTAWIALSPSMPQNGCLQVVLGSHDDVSADILAGSSIDNTEQLEPEVRRVHVTLQAGEMSLHDGRLLHGSTINSSNDKRIGFAVRYVSPAAKPIHGCPPALLARGSDEHRHFRIVSPPAVESDEALEQMRQSASRHLDAMIENLRRRKTAV
jgi:non-haem Fe2+, alpha-ketoglutarate-dependent halogenase